ncbi:MAG TPA: protein kinase [Candidatus Bathyarchaeia archaeon]|jgi:serine/threonine protein kinase|nr:protein kinase [Candidatus Bathyarchaeia archaeon]
MRAYGVSMSKEWKRFEGQSLVNKFPLQKLLGSTSYGAVFLTQSPPPETKNIAVKLIIPGAKADFQLSLLQRASKLSHPNLLHLMPGGRCQLADMNLVFSFLEFAEEDLGRSLQDRPLTENEAREMLGPLLEALSYIHAQGLAHSHIKPSNIMAIGNLIKLATDTILPLGEPRPAYRPFDAYDAPEVATALVNESGDAWSLGVTLVEVLTQKAPVSSPESQDDPVVPSTIPQPFLDIAQNCLRRDPSRRWTTAQIAECLNPAPIQVSTPVMIVSDEKEKEAAKESPTPIQVAAPPVVESDEKKTAPPKELWVDSNYCWVVVCRNNWFHRRPNIFNVHRIPLGQTDAVMPRPEIDKPFVARCDECGKKYTYAPSDVLKYEMEVPASFVAHPLFRHSLEPDETDKYESTPLPQPTSKKRPVRTVERVAALAFVLLIAAQFVLTNLPKLSADVSDSIRPNDLTGGMFSLSNKGSLSVYDVKAGCKVMRVDTSLAGSTSPVEGTTVYFPESMAEILSPGERMTVPCGRAIAINQNNASTPAIYARMFFVVTYRPKGVWWHKSENFPMETTKTENGMWIWKSIPR